MAYIDISGNNSQYFNYIDNSQNIYFKDLAGNVVPYIATIQHCLHLTTIPL